MALPARGSFDTGPRIQSLDILRGLALFGMILVHFHQKMGLDATGVEDLIGWAVYILVEQKAWGTFACLFGMGFAVLLRRLDARGVRAGPVYLRRLAALALFGVFAEVGFGFHVLFSYAVWGVALLAVRNWSSRLLLLTAGLAAMAEPLAAEIRGLTALWMGAPPAPNGTWPLVQAVDAAAAHGTYAGLLVARWRLFVAATPGGWSGMLPDSNLALFIIGLLAVRHRVIDDPWRHARTIAGWMIFGAASWLVYWTALRRLETIDPPGVGWPLAMGLGLVREQWLCFTYIGAVILLLAYRPRWSRRLKPIGDAGRMALTNYLLQAAILDALASGYGVAVRIRPLHYLPAALLLFGCEILLSIVWLARFRFGPLEWAWRLFTYQRWGPIGRLDTRDPDARDSAAETPCVAVASGPAPGRCRSLRDERLKPDALFSTRVARIDEGPAGASHRRTGTESAGASYPPA